MPDAQASGRPYTLASFGILPDSPSNDVWCLIHLDVQEMPCVSYQPLAVGCMESGGGTEAGGPASRHPSAAVEGNMWTSCGAARSDAEAMLKVPPGPRGVHIPSGHSADVPGAHAAVRTTLHGENHVDDAAGPSSLQQGVWLASRRCWS